MTKVNNFIIIKDWKELDITLKEGGFKSYYKDDNKGLRQVKSEITINKPLKTVYEFLAESKNRTKYSPYFDSATDVKTLTDNLVINYQKTKGKFFVDPRDFVTLLHHKLEDDNAVIFGTSTIDSEIPEKKGFVRGYFYYTGYLFKKVDDDACHVTFFNYVRFFIKYICLA